MKKKATDYFTIEEVALITYVCDLFDAQKILIDGEVINAPKKFKEKIHPKSDLVRNS
jgi:hypothetical protein